MSSSILDAIKEYLCSASSIWHTPGHKGELCPLDITEIDNSFPADHVQRAESKVAQMMGVGAVRFLTNGSSIGIKAGIMSLDGEFLIESNCHQAVREALALAGKTPFVIENLCENGLCLPLEAHQIEKALSDNPRIKNVVITSPDYYGQVVDAQSILDVVRRFDLRLYVDAAHGAHFAFRPDLFPESLISKADICNISAHKTLHAFTQSAYLVINNLDLIERIDQKLCLLGTTSPSYLLLSGLEFAANYTHNHSYLYDRLLASCLLFRKHIRCIDNGDFSRLVVDARYYGISGIELYKRLKKHGVIAEKFDESYVVFIATIADSDEKINDLAKSILLSSRQNE